MIDEMNKGIKDIQNICLTKDEKKNIFEQVMKTPVVSPYAPVPTMWNYLRIHRSFAYVFGSLLIFIMIGGTLAYAAEGSVPGDLLYPIKMNITEPIRDILAITPLARAKWEAEKAIRRLDEAKKLVLKNNLTSEYRDEIEKNFNKNIIAFHDNIQSLASTTIKAEDIKSSFEKSINEHSDILEKINPYENSGEQKNTGIINIEHKININEQGQSTSSASSSQKNGKRKEAEELKSANDTHSQ